MIAEGVAAGAAAAVAAEAWLRRRHPHRLWRDAFDEASVMEPHATRGFRSRPGARFAFHHRYLERPNPVRFDAWGLHDRRPPEGPRPPGTLRIQVFGGSTAVGWELRAGETVAARLETRTRALRGAAVQVQNAAARHYATGQLYDWYREDLAAWGADVVVYHFNLNHPRRAITLHESGKPVGLHQPVYGVDPDGRLRRHRAAPARHRNDLIYLRGQRPDGAPDLVRLPGADAPSGAWQHLRDHSHLACALEDWWLGPTRLRRLRDRAEIKDLEHRTAEEACPFQWRVVGALLRAWNEAVRSAGARFAVSCQLGFYNAPAVDTRWRIRHPLGFAYDEIPERRHLRRLTRDLGIPFFDSYAYARDRAVDTTDHYLHPRYAYPSPAGADFHARVIAEGLRGLGWLDR